MLGRKEPIPTKAIAVALAGAIAAITARPAFLRSPQGPVTASTVATADTPGHTGFVTPSYPAFRIEDALSR